jgi:lisH domain-containing protein FOPNL
MSVADLKDALRDALERSGKLNDLRSQIRQSVFSAMEDPEDTRPQVCGENIIINELIREYLSFNNYRHTLAVFAPEVGLPSEPLRRNYIAQQTSLPEKIGSSGTAGAPDLPLLYALLAGGPQQSTRGAATIAPPVAPASPPQNTGAAPTLAPAPPLHASLVDELGPPPSAPPPPPFSAASVVAMSGSRRPAPTPVIFTAAP